MLQVLQAKEVTLRDLNQKSSAPRGGELHPNYY